MDTHIVARRRWWALTSVAAAQFIAVADAFIVNIAIPSIRADLHAGAAEIEAVIAVYQIAYAALLITGGRLGDILGRKPCSSSAYSASRWHRCGAALQDPR